jgi:hypothetical protein
VNTGGLYDPDTDSWSAVGLTGAIAGRNYHTGAWTGSEMIIWGGYNDSGNINTGGRYRP